MTACPYESLDPVKRSWQRIQRDKAYRYLRRPEKIVLLDVTTAPHQAMVRLQWWNAAGDPELELNVRGWVGEDVADDRVKLAVRSMLIPIIGDRDKYTIHQDIRRIDTGFLLRRDASRTDLRLAHRLCPSLVPAHPMHALYLLENPNYLEKLDDE